MAVVDVGVLGPLRVRVRGGWLAIEARRQRMVLGVLLAHLGAVVEAERLVHEVWSGNPPRTGLQSLRYHVSRLRDLLAPGRPKGAPGPISTVGSGYRLRVDADRVDAQRFERLAARGARLVVDEQWDGAVTTLDEALGLWRGEAWQDFRYEDFAQPVVRRLEERRLACLEDRVTARLGRGEHHDLVPELHELTTRHPLRERFWAQSMVALYRAGRGAEAAQVYAVARGVLGQELGVGPNPALERLHDGIVDKSLPLPGPRDVPTQARPLPRRGSTFVGRTRELADLADLLSRRRLLTVVGPGGVGKTSLAVEVARRSGGRLGHIAFVDLAAVSRDEDVAVAVVRALGVPGVAGRPTLDDAVRQVGDDRWLVVFDNCEHLTGAVARVITTLLTRCPTVTVLATSRRALHVDGEHLWATTPLAMPIGDDAAAISRSDAVRLFEDRAAAARGQYSVTDQDRHLVVEVCQRLDALPLALELAASRLRVLGIDELVEQLARPFEVLVGGSSTEARHTTLEATMAWSHRLLSDRAMTLFRRLAVFQGSFDLAAVATVCTGEGLDDDRVLHALTELVDTSLVQRQPTEGAGLTMLQTVRQFARRRLESAGEREVVRERHARYFADRVAGVPSFGSVEHLNESRRFLIDGDNHAAALDWALRRERGDLAMRLVAGAPHYWYAAPRGNDHLRWLVDRIDDPAIAPSPAYAAALCTLGLSLPWMGLADEAMAVAASLTRVAAHLDEPEHHADALWVRAAIATVAGDVRTSRDLFARTVDLLRADPHPKLSVFLFDLSWRELDLGNTARATTLVDELDDIVSSGPQRLGQARARLLRGRITYHRGDVREGLDAGTRALASVRRLHLVGPQVDPLVTLCEMAGVSGSRELAESSARGLERLLASNGEVVARPFADAALASVALARGDGVAAAGHVVDALSLMRRTRTSVALNHVLLVGARVARTQGRVDVAGDMLAARETRRTRQGVVDPAPVTSLIARELRRLDGDPSNPPGTSPDLADEALVRRALHALSPGVPPRPSGPDPTW